MAGTMGVCYWAIAAFLYAHANQRLGLRSLVFMLPNRLLQSTKENGNIKSIRSLQSIPSRKTSSGVEEGAETPKPPSQTPRTPNEQRRQCSSSQDVEMRSRATSETSFFGDSVRGKSGTERPEGSRDFTDGDDSVHTPGLLILPLPSPSTPSTYSRTALFLPPGETPLHGDLSRSPSLIRSRTLPQDSSPILVSPTSSIPTSPSTIEFPISPEHRHLLSILDSNVSPSESGDSPVVSEC